MKSKNKRLAKWLKTITQQSNSLEKSNIIDMKSVSTEHPRLQIIHNYKAG